MGSVMKELAEQYAAQAIRLAGRFEKAPEMAESGTLLMPPVTRGEMRTVINALRAMPEQLHRGELRKRDDLDDYARSLIELYEPDPTQSRQLIECIRLLLADRQ